MNSSIEHLAIINKGFSGYELVNKKIKNQSNLVDDKTQLNVLIKGVIKLKTINHN